ncbi:cytochrome P450 [Pseudovirgaria hyperparasitica]|uniref:Cytochrome P450 n=1 Tax=Pseudovirgaria hyperparasitica TaxID=470096 RepID=A0A6A6W976_9PEZI|nr:cytochrome P450 [Pseudovirgaria hyperparasitica]KAF2759428.1 cytochrome P450 [Pseudovirgaria hyperparasitica]
MAGLIVTNLLVFLVVAGLYLAYRASRYSNKSSLPLPPGPRGLPVLGNVNDLPKPGELECHHWLKHKELYGPISSITVLGNTFVIINDANIALELLRDRAAVHSGRPNMFFSSQMIGWNNTLAMSGYTEVFRQHRKNIAKVAGLSTAVSVFDRVQEEEAAHFLQNILRAPEDLFDHIEKQAGAVILRITYGYTPKHDGKDPLVDMAVKTMHEFADSTVPGKYLVDVFPFLRFLPDWAPGAGFKGTARSMAKQLQETTERPYEFVKEQMRKGKAKTSFLTQALENIGADAQMERIHKWSASSMYLGGADTTVSSLMTFFLAMMVCPNVQKKAQEELDRVIGGDRLPVSADKGTLPYIDAIVKEVHRWHPVAPMALPHCADKDDSINGYRIPKGALLLPNNWWFTHDPTVYQNPSLFKPERFLASPTHTPEADPRTWTFGYGRRVCPGRHVADNALFVTIAQALAVFDILKPVDSSGKTVEPELKFEPGVVSHPIKYIAMVMPRSDAKKTLIMQAEKEFPWGESDAAALRDFEVRSAESFKEV